MDNVLGVLIKIADTISIPNDQVDIPAVKADDATFDSIINMVFIALGAAAILFLVLGALRYITSAGDLAKIKQAKEMMIYTVAGIVVSLLAFTIVQFVLGRIIL